MSINSAMLAGVSGLVANSSSLAAISDNIANVNTVAYKRNQVNFANVVTSQAVTGKYSAGGVQGITRQYVGQQGLIQSATSSTDLAVAGDGFFIVADNSDADAGSRMFTRAGSFSVDEDGFLKNDAGLYLQGWAVAADGTYNAGPSDLGLLESINVKEIGAIVSPSSQVLITANAQRPADWPAAATAPADPADFSIPMSITDAMGISRNVTMELRRTATASQWAYTITSPDVGAGPGPGTIGSGTMSFTDGQLDIAAANVTVGGDVSLNAGVGLDLDIDWADADIPDQIVTLDLTQLSQFGSESVVTSVNPDGAGIGNVTGVEVSKEGFVSALFDNGTVRQIAKIGLATFPNPDGLQTVSGNAYQATMASGEFAIKEAGSGGAGLISPSSLEASTVDLSAEFTSLITTQRAYSASSKIITTADQMLEELLNIKR